MTDTDPEPASSAPTPPTDRESPVGEPVVRGDHAVTGERADQAVAFDPEDPDDRRRAATVVEAFASDDGHATGNVEVLRGAAAAAALVRGEGSYRAAADRAGDDVSVPFVRKWARVHDLPRSIRRQVAAGNLAPSAAKHVARLSGRDRVSLAWAAIDHDLTVREVRSIASDVSDAGSVAESLDERGIELGAVEATLPPELYCELRRRAALTGADPETLVVRALESYLPGR